ncbi:MAG: hypothetical protein WAN36_09260 [Calditrichia bacterium]
MRRTLIIFISLLFLSTGCYTIIKHPEIVDNEVPEFSHDVFVTDDCSSCHSTGAAGYYVDAPRAYAPRLNYIHRNARWSDFYETPWWQRQMFSGYSSGNAGSSSSGNALPTTSARPRYPGANSGSATPPASRVVGGGGGGSSTRVTGSSGTQSGNENNRQNENTNVRRATRGSGDSQSDSSGSNRVNRRKKK